MPTAAAWRKSLRGGVDRLFAAPVRGGFSWPGVALGAAAVVLGAAVSLWRQPGVGALNTVWAEDGTIFLSDAVRRSAIDAVTTSYAGYFHLVPRLLAALAALAPVGAAAALLAVGAALCTALVAVLVYTASAGHLTSRLSRLLVSAVVVLVPVGQGDVLNSVANLHWYGLYALFWVLIWTPRGRIGRIVAAAVVILVAGSDILVAVFLPLALVRALRRPAGGGRDRHGAMLAALLGLGLAIQLGGLLTGSSSRELAPDPARAVVGYALRAIPAPLVGERWLGTTVDARWLAFAGVAWLVIIVAAVLAWTRRVRPVWPLAAAAAPHSAALYILPVLLSGVATSRYAVAPAMLLVTALVALLEPAGRGLRRSAPLYALAALLTVVWVGNLRMDNERAHGPRWSDELDRARHSCATPGASVDVPIPPPAAPGWQVRLPCDYVRR